MLLVFAVAGALLAAVVGLAFWQARVSDAVDPSTPRAQNGFTLIAAHPKGQAPEKGVLAWMRRRTPRLRALFPDSRRDVPDAPGLTITLPDDGIVGAGGYSVDSDWFTATARASTGDTFALRCEVFAFSGRAGVYLFVHLPPGYPDTYRWLDVRVAEVDGGPAAIWRLRLGTAHLRRTF